MMACTRTCREGGNPASRDIEVPDGVAYYLNGQLLRGPATIAAGTPLGLDWPCQKEPRRFCADFECMPHRFEMAGLDNTPADWLDEVWSWLKNISPIPLELPESFEQAITDEAISQGIDALYGPVVGASIKRLNDIVLAVGHPAICSDAQFESDISSESPLRKAKALARGVFYSRPEDM